MSRITSEGHIGTLVTKIIVMVYVPLGQHHVRNVGVEGLNPLMSTEKCVQFRLSSQVIDHFLIE